MNSSDAQIAGEDVCGWLPYHHREPVGAAIPSEPRMALYKDRFATFAQWPRDKTQQPRDLAIAGLYYAGLEDYTVCFHCGGTLYRWDPQDDPWQEHAKLYPSCDYVRASKGQAFINTAQGLQEESISPVVLQSGRENFILLRALSQSSTGYPTYSESSGLGDESSFNSSQELELFSDRSMSDEESEQEIIGKAVIENTGLMDAIQEAVAESRQNLQFTRFHSTEDLVEAAKAIQARKSLQNKMLKDEAAREMPVIPTNIEEMTKELERYRKERLCKVCLVQESQMIFHPCGHLVCCSHCSAELQTCPVCRSVISQKSRAYLA